MMQQLLQFNPEIKQALQAKQPIVAIESSFISHGMPYPENLETANPAGTFSVCHIASIAASFIF